MRHQERHTSTELRLLSRLVLMGIDILNVLRYYIVGRYIALRYNVTRYIISTRELHMARTTNVDKHLPLTEATFYILLALTSPQHGYAIMQNVEQMSEGSVKLGPGTLYGALTNLEENDLIHKVDEVERRKIYSINDQGLSVLNAQVERLEIMLRNAKECRERAETSSI
jgi:DNA-binding PadR family transcriptional regulator